MEACTIQKTRIIAQHEPLLVHAAKRNAGVWCVFHIEWFGRHFFSHFRLVFVIARISQFAHFRNADAGQSIGTYLECIMVILTAVLADIIANEAHTVLGFDKAIPIQGVDSRGAAG